MNFILNDVQNRLTLFKLIPYFFIFSDKHSLITGLCVWKWGGHCQTEEMLQEMRNLVTVPTPFSSTFKTVKKDSCSMLDTEYTVTCTSLQCTAIKLKRPCFLGSASYMVYLPCSTGISGCRVSKSMPHHSAVWLVHALMVRWI